MTGAGPVPEQLRTASEWAWRLIVIVAAVYLTFSGLARVKLVVIVAVVVVCGGLLGGLLGAVLAVPIVAIT